MESKVIFATVIIFILIGSAIGLVIYFDKSSEPEIRERTFTFYIDAVEEYSQLPIVTDFVIVSNKTIIQQGQTNLVGLEEIEVVVMLNKNVYLMNHNNSDYYTNMVVMAGTSATMELYRIGDPVIKFAKLNSTNIILNLRVDNGQLRGLGFCVKWSLNILDVWTDKYILINKPERFIYKYDKCYHMKVGLDSRSIGGANNITVSLNYAIFSTLQDYDEIDIVFFDSERNYLNEGNIIEGPNGEDIGALDFVYTVQL